MARPLRIEFSGALYHVTSRGDRRENIYEDDEDRQSFLTTLAEVVDRFNWICHAYCLMSNHYHLVVETPDGNLSKGMRQLNGVYTQATNRRHGRNGHLFQGRFKGILVDGDSYLLELMRYVVLNPVRADMVKRPEQWPWSSYRAMLGQVASPPFLDTDGLLLQFDENRRPARKKYRRFVMDGIGEPALWAGLRQQVYLGDEAFVERVQAQMKIRGNELTVPKRQRRAPAASLDEIARQHPQRDDAIEAAYATGAYTYNDIAAYHDVHPATVGRVVRKRWMQQCGN